MSSRTPFDFDRAENITARDLSNTRRLRVQCVPAKNPQHAPALNIRKFRIIDTVNDVYTTEGLTIEVGQLDAIIDALNDARDHLRASGRLEAPAGSTTTSPAHRKGLVEPEKRSEVLRLAAAGLSVRQIEAQTGIGKSTVARWLAEHAAEAGAE
ncbi:helix-turn-helix domain-containing protein [Methyloversatilis sp.]|uniref:helix-turn-helix domain-containing protein n=1 Tax=Methyloversatilis sp. TaxID=2569862 RepID=UPI0035AE70F6